MDVEGNSSLFESDDDCSLPRSVLVTYPHSGTQLIASLLKWIIKLLTRVPLIA
jgi:uncharacterized membrane protein